MALLKCIPLGVASSMGEVKAVTFELCQEHKIYKRKTMKYFMILVAISAILLASSTVKMGNLEWQDNSEVKTTKLKLLFFHFNMGYNSSAA